MRINNSQVALLLVDVQNDFLPGGALAVKEGDRILPVIQKLQGQFSRILATQDFHPQDHESFAANHSGKTPGEVIDLHGFSQVLWPVHCVQGTWGAAFSEQLQTASWEAIFQKGKNKSVDSYSGFFDNARRGDTGLYSYLHQAGIRTLVVCGLALDYCVKFTALDAQELGFETYVITDATRAVNLHSQDGEKALEELKHAGVKLMESTQVLAYV
ncbi:MAG: bifunctional nicotinamidase/pyrazinamidase [Bacteroidetes bacterium]|nr:bifunctional nicotinamidase/pyrazinamidase [Bacteroidota bacterium]